MFPPIFIQSYALVLVTRREDLTIEATSKNSAEFCGVLPADLLGKTLHDILPAHLLRELEGSISEHYPGVVSLEDADGWPSGKHQVIMHAFVDELVVEIEPRRSWPHSGNYAARLNDFTQELEETPTMDLLLQRLCDGLVYHFGYDRALVVKFDDHFDSIVSHEAPGDMKPLLLNVRFCEEDLPAPARYNQLVDVVHNYTAVEEGFVGIQGELGAGSRELVERHIASRAPFTNFTSFLKDIHMSTLGYLSLVVNGNHWGNVYLLSEKPMYLDYQMRAFLKVVGRVAQQKMAYHLYSRSQRLRSAVNLVRDRLQENIVKSESLTEGLTSGKTNLLELIDHTHGAAICSDEVLTLFGTTPSEAQINAIVKWMKQEYGDHHLWHTDNLGADFPPAGDYPELVAGILFLPLDVSANQWILWFSPEKVQRVTYGSVPDERPGPVTRRFQLNEITRHGHSMPWETDTVGAAEALQSFIQDVVMKRYARTKKRNSLLQEAYKDLEAFSYTIGHDLQAPLRGISSYAEIIEEEYAEQLGRQGTSYVEAIRQNAERMRVFMTDLLSLSRIDRSSIIINELSVAQLVKRVLRDRATHEREKFDCIVQPDLPPIYGDRSHLLTLFTNLVSNSIKYSSREEAPRIEIGLHGHSSGGYPVFYVADNGIGIPADQHYRIFELFGRSTNAGEYPGTGIGLALVQRIINFHDGDIWIESELGKGTRILFYTGMRAVSSTEK